jgi:hypothetical protein
LFGALAPNSVAGTIIGATARLAPPRTEHLKKSRRVTLERDCDFMVFVRGWI